MLATAAHLARFALLLSMTTLSAAAALAAPKIDIDFETDAVSEGEFVRARTVFRADPDVVYTTFSRIAEYPALHDWVRATELVNSSGTTREFIVKFHFPWPVGSQWSRIEVHTARDAITWKQLEGSLEANHGRLRFEVGDDRVGIDYRAAIDVGMPDLWTRSYRKKFVTEFLTAVRERTTNTGQMAVKLASSRRP
ncbi:MAG: hypothetical protein PVJ83_06055 [Gammaproteobacteria bacterium]|jgi:uncharacterized membrane protein